MLCRCRPQSRLDSWSWIRVRREEPAARTERSHACKEQDSRSSLEGMQLSTSMLLRKSLLTCPSCSTSNTADDHFLGNASIFQSALADIQSLQHQEKPPSEIQTLLQCISKRREALEACAGREDLIQQYNEEIAVLDEYIPEDAKEMSLEDLKKLVEEAVKELGAEGDSKSLNKVIKHVRTRAGLRVSSLGKEMADIAKKALTPSS